MNNSFFSHLTPTDIINICLCILSFLLAAISVLIVIITLRQNNKMLEQASRPVISIYLESVILNEKRPIVYLVVKNYGNSTAYMDKFVCDFDLTKCYDIQNETNYIDYFSKCSFAPGQSRICYLNPDNIADTLSFTIKYSSDTKKYQDTIKINVLAQIGLVKRVAKVTQENASMITAEVLQESLIKNL